MTSASSHYEPSRGATPGGFCRSPAPISKAPDPGATRVSVRGDSHRRKSGEAALFHFSLPRDFVRALSGARPTFGLGHSAENSRRVANSISNDLCMINGRGGL